MIKINNWRIFNMNTNTFNYSDYLTFVDYVVSNTIRFGAEYQNFFTALAIAQMFYGYEIVNGNSDNNEWDIDKVFDDIRNLDCNNVKRDIYEFVCNTDHDYFLPIKEYLYEDMIDQISNKLWLETQKNPVRDSLAELLRTANAYLENMEDKMSEVDMSSALTTLTNFAELINDNGKSEITANIAKEIHKDREAERAALAHLEPKNKQKK